MSSVKLPQRWVLFAAVAVVVLFAGAFMVWWRVGGSSVGGGQIGVGVGADGFPIVRTIQCPGRVVGELEVSPNAFGEGTPIWRAELMSGAVGQLDVPMATSVPGYTIDGSVEGVSPQQQIYLTSFTDNTGAGFGSSSVIPFTIADLKAGSVLTKDGKFVAEEQWGNTPIDCSR